MFHIDVYSDQRQLHFRFEFILMYIMYVMVHVSPQIYNYVGFYQNRQTIGATKSRVVVINEILAPDDSVAGILRRNLWLAA